MTALTAQPSPTPQTVHRDRHITVKVNCGCGARFTSLEEGESHALTTGHTLTISGEIRASYRF